MKPPTIKTIPYHIDHNAQLTYGRENQTGIYIFEVNVKTPYGLKLIDAFAIDTHRHPNHTRVTVAGMARIMHQYGIKTGDIIAMCRYNGE